MKNNTCALLHLSSYSYLEVKGEGVGGSCFGDSPFLVVGAKV